MTIQNNRHSNSANISITEHYKSLPGLSSEGLDALVQFLLYAQSKGDLNCPVTENSDIVA